MAGTSGEGVTTLPSHFSEERLDHGGPDYTALMKMVMDTLLEGLCSIVPAQVVQ